MKNLLFDLTVNKENKTIHVTREFDAELQSVWDCWTKSELLDQWWAPKPYHVETKSMDFREGGTWFYAMVSPENEKHWCKVNYKKIKLLENILHSDLFCDEDGNVNTALPSSTWTNSFSATEDMTTVNITLEFEKLEDLEALVEMGFKEGFAMGLANLDELLSTLK